MQFLFNQYVLSALFARFITDLVYPDAYIHKDRGTKLYLS